MKVCVSFQAEGTTLKERWVRLSEVCVHYIVALFVVICNGITQLWETHSCVLRWFGVASVGFLPVK